MFLKPIFRQYVVFLLNQKIILFFLEFILENDSRKWTNIHRKRYVYEDNTKFKIHGFLSEVITTSSFFFMLVCITELKYECKTSFSKACFSPQRASNVGFNRRFFFLTFGVSYHLDSMKYFSYK